MASFLDEGAIDEFIISVIATFIGDGIPLIEPGYAVSVACRHRPSAAVDAVILQIRLPLSSETMSAPSGATVTPTGRPHC